MRQPESRPVPSHWLRPNEVTRVPRRHVFLDTETRAEPTATGEVQSFRLAVGMFDRQTAKDRPVHTDGPVRLGSPAEVWAWVDGCTAVGKRTVCWCHNLGFDMRISNALGELPALGWELELIRLNASGAFATFKRDGRTLTLADSTAFFPGPLADVADTLGMVKPPLPSGCDDAEAWWSRCEADVAILRAAVRLVLDWVQDADLGNWRPTGAGQGWAAFRHRQMTHKILHHDNALAAAHEREAAYAGRCEAWMHGRLPLGPWHEVDFTTAYAQVAHDMRVPTRFMGRLSPSEGRRYLNPCEDRAALLLCDVETDTPTVPTRTVDGIVWPVGRFRSWLWDIEAREAVADGATVKVAGCWLYHTDPALQSWAAWIFALLDTPDDVLHPLLKQVVKGWSRSVVGRFGSQVHDWERFSDAFLPALTLSKLSDGDTGEARRLLTLARDCYVEGAGRDSSDGAVHVMSFIMSASRVKLWRMMRTAGLDQVAYVDTDGALVTSKGLAALEAASVPGLRLKGSYSRVAVYGPKVIEKDGRLRASGIPSKATKVAETTWQAEVWQSLPASLTARTADRVTVTDRSWTLRGLDRRRAHLDGHRTAPLRLESPA